jgi:methylenetetrahydrofolate dehydrogenase (NADP+)/methenyltetrahydrofolate cyclohydrolase
MKFDGKAFSQEIEVQVSDKVAKLKVKPRIVSVLVGDDPASALYTKLKQAAAERVGIDFEIVREKAEVTSEKLKQILDVLGQREDVTGVMVQLPLPGDSRKDTEKILAAIPLDKDVDGLRYPESGVVPPVVKAILDVVEKIGGKPHKFVVIGASGFVGSATCLELEKMGKEVIKVDSDTVEPTRSVLVGDVVISCVGKEGVVTEDMVRDGVIAIDVGAPRGDMTSEVYQKASISVEVPGGIGPVTIACLMQNAVSLSYLI